MRTITCLAMSVGLASCSAALDDGFTPAVPRPAPPAAALAPVGAVLSSPSADRSRSILAYHDDLEACRRDASAGLGSAALDDVAALKRAVAGGAGGAGQGAVTVSHRSDDPAVRRDRAVKACLSKRGYVLKD